MASVIKSNLSARPAAPVVFSFEDAVQHTARYIDEAQAQAAAIIAAAHREAESIRRQAQQEGRDAAHRDAAQEIDQIVAQKIRSLQPALEKAISQLIDARQSWLRHWEQNAVHLSAKIAERVIRRELSEHPAITVDLVREALELAAGSPRVKIALNPDDFDALGPQIQSLIKEISKAAETEIIPDRTVSAGGCRVETRQGLIDQQVETQLDRIFAELTGGNE
jgi:flagellar assembly protein FliH